MMRALLATVFFLSPAAAFAQGFDAVSKVYVWPMQASFDQYLAQELARQNAFRVVVDPKDADAVLTDRIDQTFLDRLVEMFAEPEPEPEPEESDEQSAGSESIEGGQFQMRQGRSSFNLSKGNLFLVGVNNRSVIWSTYLKEFEHTPDRLNRQAQEVVQRLLK